MAALFKILSKATSSSYPSIARNVSLFRYSYWLSSSSSPPKYHTEQDLNKEVSDPVLRRRLIFRCKNRGIKELDLLLGNWAVKNVPILSPVECDELQIILNEETLDLVSILIKREDCPAKLNNSVMQKIMQWRNTGNVTGYKR
eukprot:524163_1